MRRRTFIATAAASALWSGAASARADAALETQLDALLTPYVTARDFSGVVLMRRRGTIVAHKTYGAANFATNRPSTANTKYFCASIGKMFTRATIIALERAGKLSQDDAFARFAPNFPNAANFTIRQLTRHTAGISRDLSFGADATRHLSTEELMQRVAAMPMVGAPGERAVYANNGYRLLAYVIERAGGGDYGELVREAVFEPRRMRDTGEPRLGRRVRNAAQGYVAGRGLGTLEPAPVVETLNDRGAGSFYSTPNDLMRFAQTLPLEPGDLERASANGAERPVLGHNGLGHGCSSFCYRFPNDDAELVMMCNIQTGIFTPLENSLSALLFGETPPPIPLPPTTVAPLDQARTPLLVGNYELFPGTPLIVRQQGDLLEVSAGGDEYAPLTPLGGDRYFMRQRYATLTFAVTDGPASAVLWAEPGGEFNLRRLPPD